MDSLRIGIAGVGTVGACVAVKLLAEAVQGATIKRLAVRDINKDRGFSAPEAQWTQNTLELADADDVEKALLADPSKKAAPPENPMSADRVKWEHIHRVFELCNRNVSETARRLKMHRRTLQRILSKRSPR